MRKLRISIVVACLVLGGVAYIASAQVMQIIERRVIGAGGSSAGRITGTFGQAFASVPARSCAGFWCGELNLAAVGQAIILYTFTFGQVGIAAAALLFLALYATRSIYDLARQLWTRPLSR
jgi:hypothetical protein